MKKAEKSIKSGSAPEISPKQLKNNYKINKNRTKKEREREKKTIIIIFIE